VSCTSSVSNRRQLSAHVHIIWTWDDDNCWSEYWAKSVWTLSDAGLQNINQCKSIHTYVHPHIHIEVWRMSYSGIQFTHRRIQGTRGSGSPFFQAKITFCIIHWRISSDVCLPNFPIQFTTMISLLRSPLYRNVFLCVITHIYTQINYLYTLTKLHYFNCSAYSFLSARFPRPETITLIYNNNSIHAIAIIYNKHMSLIDNAYTHEHQTLCIILTILHNFKCVSIFLGSFRSLSNHFQQQFHSCDCHYRNTGFTHTTMHPNTRTPVCMKKDTRRFI
jgi:hypothetical protein